MRGSKSRKKVNNYIIDFDHPLGAGASGKVFLCVEQTSQTWMAVKIIEKSQFDNNPYMAEAVKMQLMIHRSLKNENIVSVADVIQTVNNYYIVMEFCQHGSLRSLITKHTRLSEQDAVHCLRCICRAFEPMFEKGIMHRDLKPENIVMQNDQLKVTDFGFAKALSSSRELTRTVIGTPLYMSPQILSKQPYSSKCDIWSIGVIFYQLMVGQHPWTARSLPDLYRVIINSPQIQLPAEIIASEQTKQFLNKCLQVEESSRFSWLQIYQHELMGTYFQSTAKRWRKSYESAAQKLNQLRHNVEPQKLVGVFLRLKVSALNFPQFSAIMRSLNPIVEEAQLGPMYELFDKDNNGVIDFEQFVGALSDCPQPVLQTMNRLLMKGYSYSELSNRQIYLRLVNELDENPEVCQFAYALISNMEMGE